QQPTNTQHSHPNLQQSQRNKCNRSHTSQRTHYHDQVDNLRHTNPLGPQNDTLSNITRHRPLIIIINIDLLFLLLNKTIEELLISKCYRLACNTSTTWSFSLWYTIDQYGDRTGEKGRSQSI